jgi:hypothetical protein
LRPAWLVAAGGHEQGRSVHSVSFGQLVVRLVVVVAIVAVVRFEVFCLTDLVHAQQTRYLSRAGWAAACVISVPAGGILYLYLGRVRRVLTSVRAPDGGRAG